MSLFKIKRHFPKSGVSLPPPPGTPIKSGMNISDQGWTGNFKIFNDMFAPGSVHSYSDSNGANHSVPIANLDADQWPTSMPAGAVAINHVTSATPDQATCTVTWQGNIDTLNAVAGQGTITNFNNTTKTATLNFTNGISHAVGLKYTFSDTVNYPKNIKVIPNGVSDQFDATMIARLKSVIQGGTLRLMKMSGVEFNGGPSLGDVIGTSGRWGAAWGGGTKASPYYKIDVANLASMTSGMWLASYGCNQDGDGQYDGAWVNHGPPIQALCQLCNTIGCNMWYAINWNCSPAAVTKIASDIRDYLDPSLTAYIEISNECWNFGYNVTGQALCEAIYEGITPIGGSPSGIKIFTGTSSGTTLTVTSWVSGSALQVGDYIGNSFNGSHAFISSFGTGTGGTGTYILSGAFGNGDVTTDSRMSVGSGGNAERHIEKTIEFMGYISAAFAAPRTGGGAKPALKRVLAWQEGPGIIAANMLSYAPDGVNQLHSSIDVWSNAPYTGPEDIDPKIYTDYTTYVDIIDAMYPETDYRWSDVADVKTALATYGIEYASYEGGPGTFLNDQTLANTLHRSPEIYDFMMYYYQRAEYAAPGADFNFFQFCGPIGTQFGVWELFEYPYQTISKSTTPKMQAVLDYVSGFRMLHPLKGDLIAKVGSTVGTKVGTLRRRFMGSSVSITSTPAGAFSFVDPTAQNLVVQVANSSVFASAGSISWDVAETGGNPVTTNHTTGTCPVTTSTFWSPNSASAGLQISGSSGLTARQVGPQTGNVYTMRGSNARTDGYFEIDVLSNSYTLSVGVGDINFGAPFMVGATTHSIGWYNGGGLTANDGTRIANWPTFDQGDSIDIYLSAGGKFYGRKNNGSWIGADGAGTVNPNTDTGGVPVSTYVTGSGGLYPAVSVRLIGTAVTGRFTDATFIHTKPTGSNQWV